MCCVRTTKVGGRTSDEGKNLLRSDKLGGAESSDIAARKNISPPPRQKLDTGPTFLYNNKALRGVAQMVARLVRDQEAVGSNPATPTSVTLNSVSIEFSVNFVYCSFLRPALNTRAS